MNKLAIVLLVTLLSVSAAFAPIANTVPRSHSVVAFAPKTTAPFYTTLAMAEDMSWEGEYPPSKVLGPIMSKMPSAVLGILSIVFASACAISIARSGVLQHEPGAMEDGSWVKWYYVLGSFGGPLAWGTHVACWIQRMNGK